MMSMFWKIKNRLILATVFMLMGNVAWAQGPAQQLQRTKKDTNREVVRTYAQAYLEANEFESAELAISDYVVGDSEDAILWNYLGLAQLGLKKFEQSCYAFQKASQLTQGQKGKELSAYQYNLADCFFRSGNIENANRTLRVIQRRVDEGESAATLALDSIQSGKLNRELGLPAFKKTERARFRVSGVFTAGYDTNVLLVDDVTFAAGSVSNAGAAFISPGVQLGYTGSVFGERLDSRMVASYTRYLSDEASGYNLMYERSDFMLGDYGFRYGVFQELAFLNPDSFELFFVTGGLNFQKRKLLSSSVEWLFEAPLRYRYFKTDSGQASDNLRSGPDLTFRAQYQRIYKNQTRLMSQALLSTVWTQGKTYRMVGLRLPQYVEVFLPGLRSWDIKNTFMFELEGQHYFQAAQKRTDFAVRPGAGVFKLFQNGVRLSLDYGLQLNYSNLNAADFKKHLVTMTAMYNFL